MGTSTITNSLPLSRIVPDRNSTAAGAGAVSMALSSANSYGRTAGPRTFTGRAKYPFRAWTTTSLRRASTCVLRNFPSYVSIPGL